MAVSEGHPPMGEEFSDRRQVSANLAGASRARHTWRGPSRRSMINLTRSLTCRASGDADAELIVGNRLSVLKRKGQHRPLSSSS